MLNSPSKIHLVAHGAGFIGCWYVFGAVYLLSNVWPKRACAQISGASSGGLLAAVVVDAIERKQLASVFRIVVYLQNLVRQTTLNPWEKTSRSINELMRSMVESHFSENTHKNINGLVGISVTRIYDWSNQLITHFESKSDLIDCLSCSCFIPGWSGLTLPKFRGSKSIDGCYTDNSPRIELGPDEIKRGERHVTIAPFFSSQIDVCPRDNSYGIGLWRAFGNYYYTNLANLKRATMALFPYDSRTMFQSLKDGFDHMKDFLLNNQQLVICDQCNLLGLNHSPLIDNNDKLLSDQHHHPSSPCLNCLLILEKISNLKLPEQFEEILCSMTS